MIHSFTAVGQSDWFFPGREFNVDRINDGIGTVQLEKKVHGHVVVVKELIKDDPHVGYEINPKIPYRFNCTAFTSGTITCVAE